jgi:hypothetical protein
MKRLPGWPMLERFNSFIDWEEFKSDLNRVYEQDRKSKAWNKPFDVELVFKLMLQQLHNQPVDKTEYQIRDCFSFIRFLGLQLY